MGMGEFVFTVLLVTYLITSILNWHSAKLNTIWTTNLYYTYFAPTADKCILLVLWSGLWTLTFGGLCTLTHICRVCVYSYLQGLCILTFGGLEYTHIASLHPLPLHLILHGFGQRDAGPVLYAWGLLQEKQGNFWTQRRYISLYLKDVSILWSSFTQSIHSSFYSLNWARVDFSDLQVKNSPQKLLKTKMLSCNVNNEEWRKIKFLQNPMLNKHVMV